MSQLNDSDGLQLIASSGVFCSHNHTIPGTARVTECLKLLYTFDKTTPNKYMSDLVEFISDFICEDYILPQAAIIDLLQHNRLCAVELSVRPYLPRFLLPLPDLKSIDCFLLRNCKSA